jgi:Tfp pilus assembly protein PilP
VTPVTRIIAFTLVTLTVGTVAPAQTSAPAATTAPAGAPSAPVAVPPVETVEPQGYTYNPEGRRDPFVSLLRRGTETAPARTGGTGLAALGTDEVSLRGVVLSQGAYVGILQGVDKTYIVRAGDKLADGTIRAISADSMVVLQQVSDPLSLEKQREVRKLLRQSVEAK